ncbi:MAG: U32 family peptidase [Kiritimatiellae bacterium]|jgi:putative protease|nr:U32 family peptidase [Kiritimatiellia bacterium]
MKPELLSPAGSYDAALAAFQYGADAVYAGLPHFSARAEAKNISMDELRLLSAYAATFSPAKKIYISFNTLLFDHELPRAFEMLDQLDELKPDGVIVQDLGGARLIKENFPNMPLHASTQMAAHNLESVLELKELGFKRVVLARELSLPEIKHIAENCGIEIEVFVHGALCYSYSGLCLFSSQTTGRSGNRGQCAYCCRHSFNSNEEESHPFSMKDLALLPIIDDLTTTGVHSLKIEGRMKNPLYVACVTDAYRKKIDSNLPPGAEKAIISDIQTVFSRPWTQFYTENRQQIPSSIIDPQTVGHRGAQVGRVLSVFKGDDNRRWLRFKTTRELEKHDGIQIDIKESERPFGFGILYMRRRGEEREQVVIPSGSDVEIEILDCNPPLIDKNAKVYCSSSQAVHRKYRITSVRASELNSGTKIDVSVTLKPDELFIEACISGADNSIKAEHREPIELESAKNPDKTEAGVRKACARLGNTIWSLNQLTLIDEHKLYIPPAILNNARRELMDKLELEQLVQRKKKVAEFEQNLSSGKPLETTDTQPSFTLKTRIFSPLPEADYLQKFSTIVLNIGHRSARQTLENLKRWKDLISENQSIVLATPLITRMEDHDELEKCVIHLIAQNLTTWEVADLSGYHILKAQGITPVSADWTLYCMNRMSSATLKAMGFNSHVISPELIDISSLFPRTVDCCDREYLVFQHTPLYISTTAPAINDIPEIGFIELQGRGGRELITQQRDKEWVTTAKEPLDREDKIEEALQQGITRFRVDWSWSAGQEVH